MREMLIVLVHCLCVCVAENDIIIILFRLPLVANKLTKQTDQQLSVLLFSSKQDSIRRDSIICVFLISWHMFDWETAHCQHNLVVSKTTTNQCHTKQKIVSDDNTLSAALEPAKRRWIYKFTFLVVVVTITVVVLCSSCVVNANVVIVIVNNHLVKQLPAIINGKAQ